MRCCKRHNRGISLRDCTFCLLVQLASDIVPEPAPSHIVDIFTPYVVDHISTGVITFKALYEEYAKRHNATFVKPTPDLAVEAALAKYRKHFHLSEVQAIRHYRLEIARIIENHDIDYFVLQDEARKLGLDGERIRA